MQKNKFQDITTERELKIALRQLEAKWARAHSIPDSRKRFKEILRIRGEIKLLLESFTRLRRSANSSDNNEGFFSKALKSITRWLSGMEKKYKDA